MRIIGIDPGPEKSAVVILNTDNVQDPRVDNYGYLSNELALLYLREKVADHLSIEMVGSYGMAVGKSVFETVYWIGRFVEACQFGHTRVYRKSPGEIDGVVWHLCKDPKASKSNIRRAVKDRFAPFGGGKNPEVGTKKQPGPLYGITGDHIYDALACAITYYECMHGRLGKVHM